MKLTENFQGWSRGALADELVRLVSAPVDASVSARIGGTVVEGVDERLRLLSRVAVSGLPRFVFRWIKRHDRPLWYAIDGMGGDRVCAEGMLLLALHRADGADVRKAAEVCAGVILDRPKSEASENAEPAPRLIEMADDPIGG